MAEGYVLVQVLILLVCFQNLEVQAAKDIPRSRTKRSSLLPKLQLSVSYSDVTPTMSPGTSFTYRADIKHLSGSMAEARGVHVVWMLTPYVTFDKITSSAGIKPRVTLADDSVVFMFDEFFWMQETHFTFNVTFDKNRKLQFGKHHVVSHVHFYYYKDYQQDKDGNVISKGVAYTQPLSTLQFEVEVPGCSNALGIKSKEILDYQITASTSYPENQPSQAREGDDAWCAELSNDQQYVQVDFPYETTITRLTTYGRRTKYQWTTTYSLQYSHDEITWYNYTENGFVKIFEGNMDRFTPKTHWIQPITTNNFRIRPLTWNKDLICMRFELYGCKVPGSPKKCIVPLGLESGEIPDDALTQSTDTSKTMSRPADIRLNKPATLFPNGWQGSIAAEDWIQIDFGSMRRVTGIAAQGAHNIPYYVTKYKLSYSNNTVVWTKYTVGGVEQELKGPKDSQFAKNANQVKIVRPFIARYLRITPTSFAILKVMRAEIYGCSVEDLPPQNDNPELEYSRRSFLLDPISDIFFVCMFISKRDESSCLSTSDGKTWNVLDPKIISVFASNPIDKHLYGLDRGMNFTRSTDQGSSWEAISKEYIKKVKTKHSLLMSSGIPDNITSASPPSYLSVVSSKGTKWGASGSGVHVMTAGTNNWNIVGSWRCCGL